MWSIYVSQLLQQPLTSRLSLSRSDKQKRQLSTPSSMMPVENEFHPYTFSDWKSSAFRCTSMLEYTFIHFKKRIAASVLLDSISYPRSIIPIIGSVQKWVDFDTSFADSCPFHWIPWVTIPIGSSTGSFGAFVIVSRRNPAGIERNQWSARLNGIRGQGNHWNLTEPVSSDAGTMTSDFRKRCRNNNSKTSWINTANCPSRCSSLTNKNLQNYLISSLDSLMLLPKIIRYTIVLKYIYWVQLYWVQMYLVPVLSTIVLSTNVLSTGTSTIVLKYKCTQ